MKKNSFILATILLSTSLYANTLAYNGSSGIVEEKNARVHKDFEGSLFYTKKESEKSFGFTFSIFPTLETNFSLFKRAENEEYNKQLNLKLLLKKEADYSPAIVYGLDDIWGTSTYSSKYLALSKKIGFFDTTLGYTKGRNTGDVSNPNENSLDYLLNSSWSNGDLFLGTEFLFKNNLSFLADFRDSKLNYGLKYSPYKDLNTFISMEDKSKLSLGISYNFALKDRKKADYKKYDISTKKEDGVIEIFDHKKTFYYDLENLNASIEKVFKSDTNYEYITYKTKDKTIKLHKTEYILYQEDRISNSYLKEAIDIKRELNKNNDTKYSLSLTPSFDFYSDKKDDLTSDIYVLVNNKLKYKSYFDINSAIKLPVYNNTLSKNSDVSLNKLYLSREDSFFEDQYLNIDFGYMDDNYSGLNIEYQKIFDNDSFAISLQYQFMQQRDDNYFKMLSNNNDAKFLNIYYLANEVKNTHLGLKVGEFLEGDRGFRIDASRSYNSYILGAYYSKTKLDNLENKRGFYIKIPFYCKLSKSQKLIPSNIYSSDNKKARFINFDNSLFNKLSNENNNQILNNNIQKIYK